MKNSQAAVQAQIDAYKALLNNGTLVMYSGAQPATPETALAGNTALATWTFGATAFAGDTTSGGFVTAAAQFVAASVSPAASGTGTFARCFKVDGVTAVSDLSVGLPESGADITMETTTLNTAIPVTASWTLKLQVP